MENQQKERQVWTNLNAGEIVPDVMTPATWSLIELLAGRLFDALFGQLGLTIGDNRLFGQINGRLYFNLNTLVGAGRRLPGAANIELSKTLGGHQSSQTSARLFTLSDEDIPNLGFSRTKLIVRLPLFFAWFIIHQPARWHRFSKEIWAKADAALTADLSIVGQEELYARAADLLNYLTQRGLKTISFSLVSMVYYSQLEKLSRKWLGDEDGSLAGKLVSGLSDVESAEAGLDLWRLADLASVSPDVVKIIRHIPDFKVARGRLELVADGDAFLESWDMFMRRHGHHARGEIELHNPRWSETPDYILATVKSHLGGLGASDPLHAHARLVEERVELTRDCLARLRNLFKRLSFNFVLRQAQRAGAVRENGKSAAIACVAGIRRLLLELGDRLAACRAIENSDDIFFLEFPEIASASGKEEPADLKMLVVERRKQYESNEKLSPPPVVVGEWDMKEDDATGDDNIISIKGLAASPGVVTGPARVILRTDMAEHVLPGEILVAPYTDPGWTPYLIAASAVVTDLGGRLSHGSIIARECGVPAVVNTQTATKMIMTGQIITVDGNKGSVTL